jgi:molybdopterin/thiamine biosynthesis adenylyltransferase
MNSDISNFFTRQEEISWFSQEKINSLTISILGIGGIGCNIALLAARLGIKKIILIDNDVIEASNLNRQTLYSKNDIGERKVSVAKKVLDDLDNLNSEIIVYDYDLFEDWQKSIEIIRESDIVMNGLDLPEIKRTLIGILCYELKKPMIYCGTDPHSGYSGMILFQSSKENEPCYECLQAILCSVEDIDIIKRFSRENILSFEKIDWKELEKKDYQQLEGGATIIITAMIASSLAVNTLIKSIHDQKCPQRIIFDLFTNNIENFFLEKREDCLVCVL